MDSSATFARHFARLVALLRSGGAVDEQKGALRALVMVSRDAPVSLVAEGPRLVANDAPVPAALAGVSELVAQLALHRVRQIRVERGATPADVLAVARAVAAPLAEPSPIATLDTETVHLRFLGRNGEPLPSGTYDAIEPPAAPLSSGAAVSPRAAPLVEHDEPFGADGTSGADEAGVAFPSLQEFTIDDAFDAAGPVPAHAEPEPERPAEPPRPAPSPDGSSLPFATKSAAGADPAELLARLEEARVAPVAGRLAEELVHAAERLLRDGRLEALADTVGGVVDHEARLPDGDLRRALALSIRRMLKPPTLRAVAQLFALSHDRREQCLRILARGGDDGAEAVLATAGEARAASDQAALYDALARLNAGVPALMHQLGHDDAGVVRNAAVLLGRMKATAAEGPLVGLLQHRDERVRREAATALGSVATARAANALRLALDAEEDAGVQMAMLAALGRTGSTDAVQYLIRSAEPEKRLFRKKPTALRVAAVQALGVARTPAAVDALRALKDDASKDVRDAVFDALTRR